MKKRFVPVRKQQPIRKPIKKVGSCWDIFEDMGDSLDKMGRDAEGMV